MPQPKAMELRYPSLGVNRRQGLRVSSGRQDNYSSPWAANCRVYDNINRRLRGGSRPGLTKYSATSFGTPSDIASVDTSSASGGASSILVVLAGSALSKVEGGVASTPVAYAANDAESNQLTNTGGDNIYFGTGSAPASGFIVVGQQHAYAVTTSGLTKFNPKTGQTDTVVATGGTIPVNCTFGAMYRDRFCLSGQDNAIYMSRMGDYTDWDYGSHVDDSNRPLAFQLALASEVGPLPTAMIAHKDANLLVGTENSLWVLSGDPAADGTLRRVSENVGILSSKAWCRHDDVVYFLSNYGVYRVNADGSGLTPLSEHTVPDELRNADPSTTQVSMGFDKDRNAVWVFLRTAAGGDVHWCYEMESESWWPVQFATDGHSPLAVCQHDGTMMIAGGDGTVRYPSGETDDGVAIASHVAIGPVRLGDGNSFGRLIRMHGVIAAGSADVTWHLIPGDTAEEASDNAKLAIEASIAGTSFSSYVHSSGTWTAGINHRSYPRCRSVWVVLWLSSVGTWAYEGASMVAQPSGRWR